MHTVDRGGVHIDQCQGCRGIFLDRGELEQMSHAEHSHYGAPGVPPRYSDSPPPYGARRGHNDHGVRHQGGHYNDSPPPYGHSGKQRRKGFLEGLFD